MKKAMAPEGKNFSTCSFSFSGLRSGFNKVSIVAVLIFAYKCIRERTWKS